MSDWLTWIGNIHYTIPQFIKEAKTMGVSRRVPRHMLKGMNWGDKVYLASKERGKKNPVVFGYFFIEELIGIQTDDLPDELKAKIQVMGPGPLLIQKRGCGTVAIGGFYATTASVEDLADYAQEPMIHCRGLKVFPKPWPVLWGMPSFRGFRAFDGKQFLEDVMANRKKPRLKHFYYA